MQNSVPPRSISGSASLAMRMKDQQEISMAWRKPALEQSTTRPCRSAIGANAIECRRKSRRPHRSRDLGEQRLELAVLAQIERCHQLRLELPGQRLDVRLGLLVEVGDRQLRTQPAERLGAAPGDRLVVGDAGDQAPATFEGHQRAIERDHAGPFSYRGRGHLPRGPQQGEGVAGDHPLLVGRDDIGLEPAGRGRDQRPVPRVGAWVELERRASPAARSPAGGSSGLCSPMPAVNTMPSIPPMAAARRRPRGRSGRRNSRAPAPHPASSLASRSRTSLLTPDRPLRPPSW